MEEKLVYVSVNKTDSIISTLWSALIEHANTDTAKHSDITGRYPKCILKKINIRYVLK